MNNRVYYGEYSLRHWISLVLKKNIILPDYQRYFVWNEKKVETLIKTFRDKHFIPPVTIGAYNVNGTNINLILDGQQRITSIILAFLGIFPDALTYKKAIENYTNDNDDLDEEPQLDNVLEWNIKRITEKGSNREEILKAIKPSNYKLLSLGIDDEFLDKNFLGFAYLVPQTTDENEQQRYYSSVFRNINIQGEPLLPEESRASLYFLDQSLVKFFSPDFIKKITVKIISSETKIDFVRYLSLLSQFHSDGNESKIARGYKQNMEKFYELYIYSAISDSESNIYGKFSTIFPEKKYDNRLSKLEYALENLSIKKQYSSIIDADMYLFGLIYHCIFKNTDINTSASANITSELDLEIQKIKQDYYHSKSPNNLGNLRARIQKSIEIYGKHKTQ